MFFFSIFSFSLPNYFYLFLSYRVALYPISWIIHVFHALYNYISIMSYFFFCPWELFHRTAPNSIVRLSIGTRLSSPLHKKRCYGWWFYDSSLCHNPSFWKKLDVFDPTRFSSLRDILFGAEKLPKKLYSGASFNKLT